MGKFRSKLKGQNKGKRWRKGQSSSSNPDTKKHRDLAKIKFFQVNLGASGLTTDAIRKHDAIETYKATDGTQSIDTADYDTSTTTTFRSIDTFATDWSECSNRSFSKLLRIFRSDSALHKEMLAVLAAVTEVIKSNGGTESSTEYYAALMTTLEACETESAAAAILSLLAMGIKTVPQPVLRVQFSAASHLFIQLLTKYAPTENNTIFRSLLTCISVLLKAQELTAWSSSSTTAVFNGIMAFVTHSKPKIRKTAHYALTSVLRDSCFMIANDEEEGDMKVVPPAIHPAATHVAQFCIQQIDNSLGSSSGQTTTLHLLTLLKDVINSFPKAQIKVVCETLLKIMTLNNPIMNSCSMQVLYQLFSGQQGVVPLNLNDQLINALYDYQPSATDVQPTLAWVVVMQQAHIHLSHIDPTVGIKRVPRIFQVYVQLWLCERPQIIIGTTSAIEAVVTDCIGRACASRQDCVNNSEPLRQCFEMVEQGLGYQYHGAWNYVLHIMDVIFNIAGPTCGPMLTSYLKALSSLRDSYKFSYNKELEYAVGAAIRAIGPAEVLKVIPLMTNNEINLDRSWLLPILKDNVMKSTLEFFNSHIRKMAEFCEARSQECAAKNDSIGTHTMDLLASQLWSLWPSFCNGPSDITENFKKIAQVIGIKLSTVKSLRLPILSGLRKLIAFSKGSDTQEIAKFAKNYIPILFNIYTQKPQGSDEEGQRLATLETIKSYLTIAPEQLINTLFTEAMKRLTSSEDPFVRESLFDLIRILCVYQDEVVLLNLFQEFIVKLQENKNHKEQKKTYRLLEEICSSDRLGCVTFVKAHHKSLRSLLIKALDSTASSSKSARLRCLKLLLFRTAKTIDMENKLVCTALAEAVICMRDINEKCRAEAQGMLIALGEGLMKSKNGQDHFIASLMAGFVGSQEMIIGTVLALASSVHHFTGTLGKNNLDFIITTICKLMQTATREVAQACLGLVKVYVTGLPIPMVAESLSLIITSLTSMTEDCKRYFRVKIRNILNRLVRKFGCDAISVLVSKTDIVMHKRLRNLRKLNARKKRQRDNETDKDSDNDFKINSQPKTFDDILADSDSDPDDMEIDEKPSKQQKKKSNVWIQEGGDNIVDLFDASTVSKIRATKPNTQPQIQAEKKDKDRGFKTNIDGRLIIADDGDYSDDDTTNKKNKISFNSDSEGESAAATLVVGNRNVKRKRPASDSVSVVSAATSGKPPMKYRVGGTGIHRPINNGPSTSGAEYRPKKAKGDVKTHGKLDPYAYLPLKRNTINKRKQLKSSGQFNNIIGAATKGARKGSKGKKGNRHK